MFSRILWVTFLLCWYYLLMHKFFNFHEIQFVYSSFIACDFHVISHYQISCHEAFALFSLKSFIALCLTFRSLIHFELIFAYGVKEESNVILLWIFSIPCAICWKDFLFPIEWPRHPCQNVFDHIFEDLFLGSLFYSTGLYVCLCANITLFWSL